MPRRLLLGIAQERQLSLYEFVCGIRYNVPVVIWRLFVFIVVSVAVFLF